MNYKSLFNELQRRANLNRDEMFEELEDRFAKYFEAKDLRTETEIKESIFEFLKDTREVDLNYDLPTNYNPHA